MKFYFAWTQYYDDPISVLGYFTEEKLPELIERVTKWIEDEKPKNNDRLPKETVIESKMRYHEGNLYAIDIITKVDAYTVTFDHGSRDYPESKSGYCIYLHEVDTDDIDTFKPFHQDDFFKIY